MITNPRAVAVFGDWHGNTPWAVKAVQEMPEDIDVIVHLGDFGYTFDKPYMRALEKELSVRGIELIFVDGNHEDHNHLEWVQASQEPREDGTYTVRKYAPSIRYAPRGLVWEFWGRKWLGVGGAYSVDRKHRVEGRSWWRGETLTYAQIGKIMADVEGQDIAVMVSHDAPNGVTVPGTHHGADFFGATNIATAEQHRAEFSNIVDVAAPMVAFHGHFHVPYSAIRNNAITAKYAGNPTPPRNLTVVRGVDCDGSGPDNLVVVREGDIEAAYDSVLKGIRP